MSALLDLLDRHAREVDMLDMPLAEWMESNIVFDPARPFPGPLRLHDWQRPIVESIEHSRETDLIIWSQAGKSLLIGGAVLRCCETQRSTMMAFHNDEGRQRFIDLKLRPILDANPRLDNLIDYSVYGGFDSKRINLKYAPSIPMAVSGSPGALQQVDAEFMFCDEVDKWRLLPESNDPVEIAKGRGRAYGDRARLVVTSTPTTTDISLVTGRYDQSCRYRRWFDCPHPVCASPTRLIFDPQEADRLRCEQCHEMLPFDSKAEVLATGRWIAEDPDLCGIWDGYHLNQFADHNTSWESVLAGYNPDKPRDFMVQQMAEAFSTISERPPTEEELEAIMQPIPEEGWGKVATIVTVDIQRRRGGEAVVALWTCHGNMRTPALACQWQRVIDKGPDREWVNVFRDLRAWYLRESPDLMFVDAGDAHGADVMELLRTIFPGEVRSGRVCAIKGWSGADSSLWGQVGPMYHGDTLKDEKRRGQVLTVNSAGTKSAFLNKIKQGRVLYPGMIGVDYPAGVLRQLCSEELRSYVALNGHERLRWRRLPGRENEALDLGTYALAGCAYLGPEYSTRYQFGSLRQFGQ